jgi:hypothetical protein
MRPTTSPPSEKSLSQASRRPFAPLWKTSPHGGNRDSPVDKKPVSWYNPGVHPKTWSLSNCTQEVEDMRRLILVSIVLALAAPAVLQGGTQRTVIAELATGTW